LVILDSCQVMFLLLMSVIDVLHVSLHSGDSGAARRCGMPACGHAPAHETGSVTRTARESHPGRRVPVDSRGREPYYGKLFC